MRLQEDNTKRRGEERKKSPDEERKVLGRAKSEEGGAAWISLGKSDWLCLRSTCSLVMGDDREVQSAGSTEGRGGPEGRWALKQREATGRAHGVPRCDLGGA